MDLTTESQESQERRSKLMIIGEIIQILANFEDKNADAHLALLDKISMLRAVVERPMEAVLRIMSQSMQNVALRIASELHLFDPMTWVKVDTTANTNGNHEDARNKQLPGLSHGTRVEVSVDDLVTNIKSLERLYGSQDCTFNGFGQVSAELVFRTMRVLAAIGIWTEIGYQRYVTNPITWLFSSRGNDGGIRFLYDAATPAAVSLISSLRSNNFQCPTSPQASPFDHAHGASLFDWFSADPARSTILQSYMQGRRQGRHSLWEDYYPIHNNLISGAKPPMSPGGTSNVFIVDVGGGQGHDLVELASRAEFAIPGRLIVQDTPSILDAHPAPAWKISPTKSSDTLPATAKDKAIPHRHDPEPIEPYPHDFFTPQPITGARCYHLRAILHDYPDPLCTTILTHLAHAMQPGYSRLLIREFILPETRVPLVPACNDLLMMCLHAGKERTERQFREILEGVGLQVTGVWKGEEGEGVIEAVKPLENGAAGEGQVNGLGSHASAGE